MVRLDDGQPSERTRVRRHAERGRYDRRTIEEILDEGLICHVATVVDDQPVVIPTLHVRVDDRLFVHGSTASRVLRALASGAPACVTVTILDALVLARSAFHHSMNYRSVVAYGRFDLVTEMREKERISAALVDHVAPGRARETRMPTRKELAATMVLGLPLTEASAKVRTGPPIDDDADLSLPIWAGVVPLETRAAEPFTATPDLAMPESVARLLRPRATSSADR